MNEQLLKDLVATAQQDNYNWDVVLNKFPELSEYDPQLLKDYIATVEKEDYNYEVANSKFPEFKFKEVESKDIDVPEEEALAEEDKTEEDVFVEMTQEEIQQVKPTEGTTTDFFKEAKNTLFGGIYRLADMYGDLRKAGLEVPLYFLLNETNENASLEEKTEFRNKLIKTVKSISDAVDPQSEFLNFVKEESLKRTLPSSDKTIYENLIKEGNYAEAGKQIVNGTVSSVPSLIAARGGLYGLLSLGISTAKGKFDENLKNPEMGLWQNLGNSLGSGTIESVGEYFTAQMIRKAGFGKSTPKEMATKILKGGYENLFKKMGVASVKEGFSEAMTSLASNIWDAFTIDEEWDWDSWLEQAFDEGVIGSVIGKSTTALGALKTNKATEVQRAQFYLTPDDVKQEQAKTIESITKVKESIKDTENENDLKVLNNSLQELEVNLAMSQIEVNNNLRRMNEEELNIYAENIDKINSANKALNSKNPITANLAKDEITKFNAENRRLLSEASKRRVGEQVETTQELLKLIKKGKGKVKIAKTPEEFQKLADQTPEGKESKQDATGSEGFISRDGNIYINLTKAAEVGAVNVGSHELLHAILNNTLSDAGARSRIINEFKKTLTKNELNLIENRLNENYRYKAIESIEDLTEEEVDMYKNIITLKDGANIGELKEEFYEEEYLNAFVDLIGDKKIRPNEGMLNKIGEFLAPIFRGKGYKNIQFNTGKDVRRFLIDYQKSFGKKQLSEEIIKLAESGAEGKLITGEVKDSFKDRLLMSKTSSDRVQNFYESRGVEAANDIINEFKPIVNKIVQRRSEAPNFDIELLTSEIELGDRGLLDLIYNYNPDSGVPLAAYINKFLPARAIEASRRVLGETFQEDISERVDIAAPEVEVEVKLKEEKVPRSLRKKLNIEKGSDLYNKVKDAVVKTFGTKLPEVTDPKFKKALSDSYKRELKKEVNALMGTRSDFKMFLTNNAETLYKSIPQETINKRFQAFSEPVLDKEGKQVREKTAVGKGVFKKKPFNKEEFINYFLGEDVGASTKGTRKTALSETIADEMALDATMEVIEDPKVFEKFKEIQEIEGKEVPKDIKPKISEKVKRPEGFKFSKTKDFKDITKYLSDIQIAQEISAVNKISEDLGVEPSEVLLNIKDNISKYKKLRNELKLKDGGAKNISSTNNFLELSNAYKSFIKNSIPKGKTFDDLPNPVQQAIIDTVGFGDTRVTIGEKPLTYKAMTNNVKGYSNLLKTVFGEDVLIGTGKKLKNIDAVFAPRNWGVFRKKVEKIVLQENITPQQAKLQIEELLKAENKTIDETLNANRELLNRGYSSLIDLIVENKNKNTLGIVADILEAQVNRATGIFKGMVPMTSFNMKPEKGNTKNENKLMHNEHLLELFNANKDFLKLANSFIKGKISEKELRSKTTNNVSKLQQAVISERMRVQKDASGASVRDFIDPLTFLGKDAVNQIPIGTFKLSSGNDFTGLNMAEFIAQNLSNVQIQKIAQVIRGKLSAEGIMVKSVLDNYSNYLKTKKSNIDNLSNNVIKFSKNSTNQDIVSYAKTVDEALKIARDPNAPIKKIRVFDFDDTLATTKSDVLFTAPDGTEGRLNAEEFAKQGKDLLEEGYVFDFSEFNKVTKGKPGPLLEVAKKIQAARGTEDVFVLTARAPEAQVAIKEFLDGVGLNIPLKNITGLGNSTGEAKANWLVDKAAEGYNDFYFADDAYQNVKAVKDAMSVIDVKSKVQQAKIKFSKSVNEDFNKIIEQTTGIASEKVYSEAKAKVRGANKGNKKFFIPYSAEDFMGLIYPLLSKGKLGDSQMAWFKENLLDPYARAQENISTDRLQLMEDFKALKKALEVPKDLRKKTDSGFTKEQAVRVYLFNKAGFDVPGISKTDLNELLELVNSDGVLKAFGDQIFNITKGDGYAKPGENWLVGTITTDLIDVLNTVKRAKYLEQSGYTANVELIFSKENLNKLEAAYGTKYREAMENILGRMKSGKNRIFSGNRLSNRVLDYINNSTGAIMFFNTRSAVLQTISSINFLNWSFNNPIKAGAAFANQPQYWKDFVELINSDYLVDRRNGLKLNINESEIADAAATSKNKAKAAINYILQKGFLPTQYADSFAIASGGATFYRNRINDLIKNQGMSEADAKKQAMLEWRETAEVSQQSSDPSKISAQQASDLGRVILAFANTPMQYARIQKRALQDLVNGRGDAKTHVSKIIYYAVVQNLIFNALQSALFGLGFGDDEDDEKKEKMYLRTANGMLDSQLRGLGLAGATVAVIKNFLTDIYERSGRDRPEYVDSVYELLRVSPPISNKISKIRGAAWEFDSKKRRQEIFDKGFSIDNPAYEAGAKVISATTNLPLDRVYSKVDNISGAMSEDAETWQTVAMLAGWPKWSIMPKDEKQEQSNFKNGNVEIITFKTSVKPTNKKVTKTKPKRKKVKLKFK